MPDVAIVTDVDEIRACADAILERYDDVPVRSFVLTLARRTAAECLRAEVCDALVGRDMAGAATR